VNVTAILRDVNDYPLLSSDANFSVPEHSAVGDLLYTVVPFDADVGDTGAVQLA
jgi:hypothetical protein